MAKDMQPPSPPANIVGMAETMAEAQWRLAGAAIRNARDQGDAETADRLRSIWRDHMTGGGDGA